MTSKGYKQTKEHKEKIHQVRLKRKEELGYVNSPETRENLRKAQLGKKHSQEQTEKQRRSMIGKKYSLERCEKNRKLIKKAWENPKLKEKASKSTKKRFEKPEERERASKSAKKRWKENPMSEEQREKMRKSVVKRIERNHGICIPNHNIKACEYFKSFDEQHNTKGKYAVHGGGEHYIEELGYFPDYINFDLKLIMEWDEKHHFDENGNIKPKDIIRQKEIQEYYSDFEFFRIKED